MPGSLNVSVLDLDGLLPSFYASKLTTNYSHCDRNLFFHKCIITLFVPQIELTYCKNKPSMRNTLVSYSITFVNYDCQYWVWIPGVQVQQVLY